jgi:hypothetical protein
MPLVVDDEQRSEDDGRNGQLPIEAKKPDQDSGRGKEVGEERDRRTRDQRVDRGGIVDDAADDAARLALVVKFQRELLEMGEDLHAQIAGDPHARPLNEIVAHHLRQGADDEDGGVKTEPLDNFGPAVRTRRGVDDAAHQPRKRQGTDREQQDDREDPDQLRLVRLEIAAGANQGPEDFVAGAFAGHGDGPENIMSDPQLNAVLRTAKSACLLAACG